MIQFPILSTQNACLVIHFVIHAQMIQTNVKSVQMECFDTLANFVNHFVLSLTLKILLIGSVITSQKTLLTIWVVLRHNTGLWQQDYAQPHVQLIVKLAT